ncbi:MAG: hypothetical protein OEO21_04125 [Candidatus Krumholzibacteria bacterium]|nr:hypothetical protein [Candidatus Krumholzibacteria bacterium]
MLGVLDLCLPILISAALVFVVSSIIHMALRTHKGDYRKLSGEEEILAAIRAQKVEPGQYAFPMAVTMKEMKTPEMTEKYQRGPVGYVSVIPNGPPPLGRSLVQWFLFSVLVGLFAGYVATLSLGRGAEYNAVFRITGTVAILGYATTQMHDSIWKGQSWGITSKFVVDGVIYGLVTAGVFGWLWP